ncbi:succinate dehydrogenase, hydrophobic membrane anchor protein [Sphingosinicellaceae bacterium]|nr:succinate dehydrogenase, hydrophobic membrane anchor protein [Sphingosinicellaceae bacterium]
MTALRESVRYRRVAGPGSGGNGRAEWRLQRLTALALIPLGLYFVVSVLHLATARSDTAANWLGRPANAFVMLLFVVATLSHAVVGLRSVLTDYVHGQGRLVGAGIVVGGLAITLCLAGVLAILKVFTDGGGS